jgi:hypothetical protein
MSNFSTLSLLETSAVNPLFLSYTQKSSDLRILNFENCATSKKFNTGKGLVMVQELRVANLEKERHF